MYRMSHVIKPPYSGYRRSVGETVAAATRQPVFIFEGTDYF
jgi:hypothetical protein